jgi:hypothetical protein
MQIGFAKGLIPQTEEFLVLDKNREFEIHSSSAQGADRVRLGGQVNCH